MLGDSVFMKRGKFGDWLMYLLKVRKTYLLGITINPAGIQGQAQGKGNLVARSTYIE